MLTRFNRLRIIQYSTYSESCFTKSELNEFLLNKTKISPYSANAIIRFRKSLCQVSKDQLFINVQLLKRWKILFKRCKPLSGCLVQNPSLLESKIAALNEFGVENVTVSMIASIHSELYTPACIFKLKHDLPLTQSISENILKSLNKPPTNIKLEYPDERSFLHHHYEFAQCQYLKWRLGSTPRIYTKKLKSLRIIERLLDIFLDVLCFEKEFILNRPYLLDMHPDKVCQNLIDLKDLEIAGRPINAVIRKYPLILMLDADNIKKLLQSMKKYRISDTAIWHLLQIFKLPNAEFIRRIECIITNPNLRVWSEHPRLLYAVLIGNLFTRRVHHLEKANRIRSTSITTITAPNNRFLRYMNNQLTRVWVIQSYNYILRGAFGISDNELTDQIKRHPNWRRVSIIDVKDSINYLKKNFQLDDIRQSIHIILYPCDLIIQTLDFIYEQYCDNNQYNFTSAQNLMMCVYLLEKNTHFSGNGVWSTEKSEHRKPWLDHQPTNNVRITNIKKHSEIQDIEPLKSLSLKDNDVLLNEMMEDHWSEWPKKDMDSSHC